MAIYNIFSKRRKIEKGEVPDVYAYDNIPESFRVQLIHILRDAFGTDDIFRRRDFNYKEICGILCREYGTFRISDELTSERQLFDFILTETNTNRVLDAVELTLICVDTEVREYPQNYQSAISADDAIAEANQRFREHGLGYKFESSRIIRIDSELLHQAVVKPALQFLHGRIYTGANAEFLSAFEHYRHGNNKEALNDCLKAFESVMKSICKKRKWKFSEKDTSKTLIEICISNGLIPSYLLGHYSSLRSGLESGIPTIRNRESAHGQGDQVKGVTSSFVSYMIHLTATTILFLAQAEQELE